MLMLSRLKRRRHRHRNQRMASGGFVNLDCRSSKTIARQVFQVCQLGSPTVDLAKTSGSRALPDARHALT